MVPLGMFLKLSDKTSRVGNIDSSVDVGFLFLLLEICTRSNQRSAQLLKQKSANIKSSLTQHMRHVNQGFNGKFPVGTPGQEELPLGWEPAETVNLAPEKGMDL